MSSPRTCLLLVPVVLLASALAVRGEDWPCWRGPRGDGTSIETAIPTQWSGTDNVVWKVAVPGIGHASAIVVNGKVLTVTCKEETHERLLLCYDRQTGKELWQRMVLDTPLEKKHQLNSRASSTPASDGKMVVVAFLENLSADDQVNRGNIVVASYDLDGKQQWLVKPGIFSSTHGFCSNPVLFENLVIINGDHDGDSYLVALEKSTGRTVWKVDREHKTRSYSTPLIRTVGGKPQMILSGSKCVASYDPRTGKQIWVIDGPTEQYVASIVDNRDLLFMTCGFPDKHLLAIRKDGQGNITKSHIAWRTTENCSYVPSPVVIGDYFLIVADNGIASCYRAATGERQWKERIGRRYSASLVSAEGLAYFTSDDGLTTVVRPGPTYEAVAANELGEACYASPAISNGQIFLRGEKHLFCIGAKK